ncbi:ParB/RepB/Spo0J family partition protein [Actinocorallia longicatena]|uniref:ParB N-terminal domain-containing protein n=1 Tax=Actinocorallia longicatena TaxID=111803 RepID=A0ABP6QL90_9ACTN
MEPHGIAVEDQPVTEVEIGALSTAGSPRSGGEDDDHVAALTAAGAAWPPIVVHRPTMRVIDGRHRLRAAAAMGRATISAVFFDGPEPDAFVLAVRENVTHGLPLTMADRRRAAECIIASHPRWSDRMIASVAGLSAATVAEARARAGGAAAAAESRVGQDGRVRPINGAVGRGRAAEIIRANPGYSLRRIAREAGISPETARDVRNRLLRGEDPLRPWERAGARTREQGASGGRPEPDAKAVPLGRGTTRSRNAVVERLMADPSLRSNEKGRALLQLLALHAAISDVWDELIESVPAHCSPIVADLAGDLALLWSEFEARVELKFAETG